MYDHEMYLISAIYCIHLYNTNIFRFIIFLFILFYFESKKKMATAGFEPVPPDDRMEKQTTNQISVPSTFRLTTCSLFFVIPPIGTHSLLAIPPLLSHIRHENQPQEKQNHQCSSSQEDSINKVHQPLSLSYCRPR